jgi:hypothetical protein
MTPYVALQLVAPINDDVATRLRNIAYDVATCLLSETTNSDACDVIVRERSGHLNLHDDLTDIPSDDYVVVDAAVTDYLS